MKILIITLIVIQVFIDGWCIAGVLSNTRAIKTVLEITDLLKGYIESLKSYLNKR